MSTVSPSILKRNQIISQSVCLYRLKTQSRELLVLALAGIEIKCDESKLKGLARRIYDGAEFQTGLTAIIHFLERDELTA